MSNTTTVSKTIEASTEALIEAVKLASEQEQLIETLQGQLEVANGSVGSYKQAASEFFDVLQTSGFLNSEDIVKIASDKEDPVTAFAVAGQALELIADSQSSGFGVEKEASAAQEEDPWDLVKREGA